MSKSVTFLQHNFRHVVLFCHLLLLDFTIKLWKKFSSESKIVEHLQLLLSFVSFLQWNSQKHWCHGFYYFPFFPEANWICLPKAYFNSRGFICKCNGKPICSRKFPTPPPLNFIMLSNSQTFASDTGNTVSH